MYGKQCSHVRARGYFSQPLLPLLPMHPNQIYPQTETYSQPPLPSCRCIQIRFTLNRKPIRNRLYPLADASKSDLSSTGNLLSFISLALQLPFKTSATLPTPCIVPFFLQVPTPVLRGPNPCFKRLHPLLCSVMFEQTFDHVRTNVRS